MALAQPLRVSDDARWKLNTYNPECSYLLKYIHTTMPILYVKPGCPFCAKVLAFAQENGVQFEQRDIINGIGVAEELVQRGGKRQVPYLVDTEAGVEMYESDDIISYLERKLR